MHVHRSESGIEVLAPAKLNLFLEVLAKRSDGYHEIETLMVPIGWYDTLQLSDCPSGQISLTCRQSVRHLPALPAEEPALPSGADNLAVRAVELLRQRAGIERGARVQLTKRIPLAAGLAGGSSDAAAALVAANAAWDLGYDRQRLSEIGAQLGSDVPFFLYGGSAVCRGRGELVEPIEQLGPLHFVIARPPLGLSTPAVYGQCRPAGVPRRVGPLVEALQSGNAGRAGRLLHNALTQAAERLTAWIGRLKREFAALGCLGHEMSGSGSSYFGLCRHARHAQHIAASLRSRGIAQVEAVAGSF
jgi:4-diphosphocytidyl-2-C-methyl-D-erythritol kinase